MHERPAGVDAGIHQALLIGQQLKVVEPIKMALNRLGTQLVVGMAHQMKALNMRLTVRGVFGDAEKSRLIKASDIKSYAFRVRFEATDPAENDRRMLAGLALMRMPEFKEIISNYTFREIYLKGIIANSEEEEALILSEALIRQAMAQGVLVQMMMQEMLAEEANTEAEEGEASVQDAIRSRISAASPDAANRQQTIEGLAGVSPGTAVTEPAQQGQQSALGGT